MSIQHCHRCDKPIDTDFNQEHFEHCGTLKERLRHFMLAYEMPYGATLDDLVTFIQKERI